MKMLTELGGFNTEKTAANTCTFQSRREWLKISNRLRQGV